VARLYREAPVGWADGRGGDVVGCPSPPRHGAAPSDPDASLRVEPPPEENVAANRRGRRPGDPAAGARGALRLPEDQRRRPRGAVRRAARAAAARGGARLARTR